MTSEADEAISLLRGFVQLPQAGKLPDWQEVGGRT